VTSTSVERRNPTIRPSMRRNRSGDENPGGAAGVLMPIPWSFRPSLRVRCPLSMVVDDDAPDVLAGQQVVVALVDLVELVLLGDELVELDLARLVEVEHLGDVAHGVGGAEERALDRLLERGRVVPRR